MKKTLSILIFLFFAATISFSVTVLKPVNLPENWKITKTENEKNYSFNDLTIPMFVKQEIETGEGNVTILYYLCKTKDLADQVFAQFFNDKKSVYRKKNAIYTVEGNDVDVKNILRFLELPLIEQVKPVFADITNMKGSILLSETKLTKDEISQAVNFLGIKITKGIKQLFSFENSKAKLEVTIYQCANKKEAITGYKNARIKNKDDLTKFLFAQKFLGQLKWVK